MGFGMHVRRRDLGIVGTLAAPVLVLLLSSCGGVTTGGGGTAPLINYTCADCHVYATSEYNASGLEGLEGQWHDSNISIDSNDYSDTGFISSEMWLTMSTSQSSMAWIETGINEGYEPPPTTYSSIGCGCEAYYHFWADAYNYDEATGSGEYYEHVINNTTPTGDNHVYEIVFSGYNSSNVPVWDVYLDYALVGQDTIQVSSSAVQGVVGLELSDADNSSGAQGSDGGCQSSGNCASPDPDNGNEYTDTFNYFMQVNVNSSWVYWPSMTPALGAPCGQYAPDYETGYCFNGTEISNYEWSANKPA